MKIRSKKSPGVTYSKWKTPISGFSTTDMGGIRVLQTCFLTHFFLYKHNEYQKKTYVFVIERKYPYRVMDEEYTYSAHETYFNPLTPRQKKDPRRRPWPTWKLWNTDMIKELDRGSEKLIQYVVTTGDDSVEFVAPTCLWEMHEGVTVERLMQKALKERYQMKWSEYYKLNRARKTAKLQSQKF